MSLASQPCRSVAVLRSTATRDADIRARTTGLAQKWSQRVTWLISGLARIKDEPKSTIPIRGPPEFVLDLQLRITIVTPQ